MLGLCLKRYSVTPTGRAIKLDTHVDIPIEIGLPTFISDDNMAADDSAFGSFKLSLQSVVCHRGNSVTSGHYIALVRPGSVTGGRSDRSEADESGYWLRFDDLATQRVTRMDIGEALVEETPYLLFYQIMPIEGDPGNITSGEFPPPYQATAAQAVGGANLSTSSLSPAKSRSEVRSTGRPQYRREST